MLSGRSVDVPDTATLVGRHNGDADRVVDSPHELEVGLDVPERTTRMHTLCRETMGQNPDTAAGIFGDSFVDLNVKLWRRRYGAEQADPSTPGVSGVEGAHPGEETARKDVQRPERSADQKRIGPV